MNVDTVVCGDCVEVMSHMLDKSVDLIVTDPPYNIDEHYAGYKDRRPDYMEWCMEWFNECIRVSKVVVLTPGTRNLKEWIRRTDPTWVHAWYRSNATNRTGGNWINVWEPILRYGGKWRHFHDTLNLPITRQSDVGNHPCPKQLGWAEWLITGASDEGDLVFDPFLGTGTVAVACVKLHRHYFGCDIEPAYIQIANQRIEKAMLDEWSWAV